MLTLSGFEGVGKSTLVNMLSNYSGDLNYTESARYFLPLEENLLKMSKDVISLKCLLSDLNILRFFLENKIDNVIFDRNLIDALCYLEMYYPHLKWDYYLLEDHLNELCSKHNIKHIHRSSVLISHPTKDNHIKNIISDPIRKYNSTVKEYREGAKRWEDKFFELNDKLEMICENFMVISAYPEELKGFDKIKNLHYKE
jgi:predicted ATPase